MIFSQKADPLHINLRVRFQSDDMHGDCADVISVAQYSAISVHERIPMHNHCACSCIDAQNVSLSVHIGNAVTLKEELETQLNEIIPANLLKIKINV